MLVSGYDLHPSYSSRCQDNGVYQSPAPYPRPSFSTNLSSYLRRLLVERRESRGRLQKLEPFSEVKILSGVLIGEFGYDDGGSEGFAAFDVGLRLLSRWASGEVFNPRERIQYVDSRSPLEFLMLML